MLTQSRPVLAHQCVLNYIITAIANAFSFFQIIGFFADLPERHGLNTIRKRAFIFRFLKS